MFWPDYMIVALFAVIVGLVVFYGRRQARLLMSRGKTVPDTGGLQEIAAELRRSNDLLHKLVDGHEARIAALEEKSTGRKGGAKP